MPSVWEERLTTRFCERLNLEDCFVAVESRDALERRNLRIWHRFSWVGSTYRTLEDVSARASPSGGPRTQSPERKRASLPRPERIAQAAPAFGVSPSEKRTFDLITDHPMIPREHLACWLGVYEGRVSQMMQSLVNTWGLVERRGKRGDVRYTLSAEGIRYVTHRDRAQLPTTQGIWSTALTTDKQGRRRHTGHRIETWARQTRHADGITWFLSKLEAEARAELTVRADSGFYTHAVVAVCRRMDVRFSIAIRQRARLRNLIEAIPEDAWTPIPYWMDGAADVAETTYTPFQAEADAAPVRLIVRRVKPAPGSQLALFATYCYHGFITDRDGETLELEADHRRHAEIENAIRDLKHGVGLNHLPSGRFAANGAWLAVQVMAHNLARWTARIGLDQQIVTTKTLRRRVFALAGRITRSARRLTLYLPRRWPWEEHFSRALARLRAIPLPA